MSFPCSRCRDLSLLCRLSAKSCLECDNAEIPDSCDMSVNEKAAKLLHNEYVARMQVVAAAKESGHTSRIQVAEKELKGFQERCKPDNMEINMLRLRAKRKLEAQGGPESSKSVAGVDGRRVSVASKPNDGTHVFYRYPGY